MLLTYKQLLNCHQALSIVTAEKIPLDAPNSRQMTYALGKNLSVISSHVQEIDEEKMAIILDHKGKLDEAKGTWNVPEENRKDFGVKMKEFLKREIEVRIRMIDYNNYPLPISADFLSVIDFIFIIPEDWDEAEKK